MPAGARRHRKSAAFGLIAALLLTSPALGADPSPADTLRSPADSIRAARALERPLWRGPSLPLDSLPGAHATLDAAALRGAPGGRLRDVLGQELGLLHQASGSFHTPDPVDAGDLPGREPLAALADGLPLGAPGFAELVPDQVPIVWIRSLRLRPYDPLRWPNNPTGGALVDLELDGADNALPVSGTRVTQGVASTHTEEAFLARPAGRTQIRILYGDHKTAGRSIYLDEKGEDLGLRFDLGGSRARGTLGWRGNTTRVKLYGNRRWLFDRSGLDGQGRLQLGDWSAEASALVGWQRLAWEGDLRGARRRDATTQLLLRLAGPRIFAAPGDSSRFGVRPLASVELDHDRLRYWDPGSVSIDRKDTGLGFAIGLGGGSRAGHFRASVGRAAPGLSREGWVAAGEVGRRWNHLLVSANASRAVRPRLLPRLAGQLSTQVGQSLAAPRAEPSAPLEVVWTGEVGLAHRSERTLELRLRALEIEHAVSTEGGLVPYLTPEGYPLLPESAYDARIRCLALHLYAKQPLPLGFWLAAGGAARASDPSWQDNLWMAPWDARFEAGAERQFFGTLRLSLYLRGTSSGPRAALLYADQSGRARRTIPLRDRYDAGIRGEVADARFFFELQNLEDDLTEASGFDGGWVVLPLRSLRMGLSWMFVD